MLNQSLAGLEFSCIVTINIIAMKGRIPNVRLMNLYFPILWIDHLRARGERGKNTRWGKRLYPANIDPTVIDIPLGKRCKPGYNVQELAKASHIVALTSDRGG